MHIELQLTEAVYILNDGTVYKATIGQPLQKNDTPMEDRVVLGMALNTENNLLTISHIIQATDDAPAAQAVTILAGGSATAYGTVQPPKETATKQPE